VAINDSTGTSNSNLCSIKTQIGGNFMLGKVTVWYMSEEERLAYIAKHPIVPTKMPTEAVFANLTDSNFNQPKKNRGENSASRKSNGQ
jgi:hypothetical protein